MDACENKKLIAISTLIVEGKEHGIFFRNPIQTVTKDSYSGECYHWRDTALFKVIPFLLNIFTWFKCKKWFENDEDLAGIKVKELCSPIYFTRDVRRATHFINDHPAIQEIDVYGWEPYKNSCGGAAEKEIAVFIFKNGKKKKMVTKESFNYFYNHVIKDMITTNLVFIEK